MLVLLQLASGVLLAMLVWMLVKTALKLLLWGGGFILLAFIVFPGLLLLAGTVLFTIIASLATLGLLLLVSAFRH